MRNFLFIISFVHILGFTYAKSALIASFDLFEAVEINNEPIIGVLSQEISFYLNTKYPEEYNSYIAASYVKFVEGGGARVVPIW